MSAAEEQSILDRISATGLTILKRPIPTDITTTEQAWQKVNNIETEPATEVPIKSPDALSRLDQSWLAECANGPLFTKNGEFYISIGGPGSLKVGWTAVQWSQNIRMSNALIRDDGHLEFVAMSIDGNYICAVSTEDEDYWIIEHRLS
ncbi:hypothetical protein [Streptomyces purpurogeneiscleroticus]|uniref:hypothetical protein n=1 Tax=Streptomyces purpurogeneiscleroticus TaxID=68259 RepID=UPI001CBE512E|nr:hypothetical protein [Streptomyces purpurogeneiscleroticus]